MSNTRGSVSHNYEYISTYSNATQQIVPDRFVLKIRQQPIQTRQSTNNERGNMNRRPLDPPPIVQIELDNSTAQENQDFLQNPYLFMCVSLVHSNNHEEIINTIQNKLSGQTSSSMYKLKDINNHDGGFFVFGDVSVKLEGQFRLKFSMFEISKFGSTNLKSIYSNIFQVYSSKSFPGILESTFLSRSFSDQGVRIRIRKEHRVQMTGSRKRKLSLQDEELELNERSSSYIDISHQHYYSQQQQQQFIQQQPTLMPHYPYSSSVIYQSQQRPQQRHWSPNIDNNNYNNRRDSLNNIMTTSSDTSLNPRRCLSHIDRRPSIPFSPPHESYDNSRVIIGSNDYNNNAKNHYHHNQQQQIQQKTNNYLINVHHKSSMIPSPPPQPSLFRPELRRLSLDDTLSSGNNHTVRRRSADPYFYNPTTTNHYNRYGSQRMSLQQHSSQIVHPPTQPPPTNNNNNLGNGEVIRLPPLRSIVPTSENNNNLLQPEKQHTSPPLLPPSKNHQHDGIGEVDAAVAMMQLASRRQAKAKINY